MIPRFLLLAALICALAACDRAQIYEDNIAIPDCHWYTENKLSFSVQITDTTELTNLLLALRNTDDYPYQDLWIFMKTTFPNDSSVQDTLHIELADHQGKWLGSGISQFQNLVFLKENYRFEQVGNYVFSLEQAMRVNPIKGISTVGIRLEKVLNN